MKDKTQAVFTVKKDDASKEYTVTAGTLFSMDSPGNQAEQILGYSFREPYSYAYLPDVDALYFMYNMSFESTDGSFSTFNKKMFAEIEEQNPAKIIIDLRSNTGGDPELWNPFIEQLAQYGAAHPNLRIYTLTGPFSFVTFQEGFSQIMEAVPTAISVGEPTLGTSAGSGQRRVLTLPNRESIVVYPTKKTVDTEEPAAKAEWVRYNPDVLVQITIENLKNGEDAVLAYAFEDQ